MVIRDDYIYKIDFNRKIINIRITSVKLYKEINKKKEFLEDNPLLLNKISLICLLKVSLIVKILDIQMPS